MKYNKIENYSTTIFEQKYKKIIKCEICDKIMGFINMRRRITKYSFVRCRECEKLE